MKSESKPYESLLPATVMEAVESVLSQRCTGQIFPLNSFENRVYDITMESNEHIIAKFYRPGRWSEETILEEHAFSAELTEKEIDVVSPLEFNGKTLFDYEGFSFALYPKRGGRPFECQTDEDLRQIGRLIGRIHLVGEQKPFQHRMDLTPVSYGHNNIDYIANNPLLPAHIAQSYLSTARAALEHVERLWQNVQPNMIRLHGDFHLGNILKASGEPFFVDLDDCLMGPAMQDIWMLLTGEEGSIRHQFNTLLEGYEQMRLFDDSEFKLLEALRTLRMIHYTAWLTKRWHDPTFPKNFPFFEGHQYWEEQILTLREQVAKMQEPVYEVNHY